MSRATDNLSEFSRVDAVVLAGCRGTPAFDVDGEPVHKPFLVLGGEPLVARVARVLLAADRVRKVVVVGPREALESALDPLGARHRERLLVIDEGQDLLDNCYRAFFLRLLPALGFEDPGSSHLDPAALTAYRGRNPAARDLPALFVTSDLPFLTTGAVDAFVEQAPRDVDVAMGMVDHRELERMRDALREKTALDSWKLGAIPLYETPVRLNNLFLVRPLRVEPALYTLLRLLYAHRWLLQRDGKVYSRNWWDMARAMIRYACKVGGVWRVLRAVINFVPAVVAMYMARLTQRVGGWLSWPFRVFLRKRDMEFIGSRLFRVRGYLLVSSDPGPAFDIDVEESYTSLVRDNEREFAEIQRYLHTRE